MFMKIIDQPNYSQFVYKLSETLMPLVLSLKDI